MLLGDNITFDVRRDVQYGNWDNETRTFTELPREDYTPGQGAPDNVSGTTIPDGANAVRVRLIRSASFGNPVPLFFAPIIGTSFSEIQATAIASLSPSCSGFIGIDRITLLNDMATDAFNSDLGIYGGQNQTPNGDVCSNGPITLSSGADVRGNARGAPVTIASESGASISGHRSNSPAGLVFDPVDFTQANVNDNATIERGPAWAPPFYNSSKCLFGAGAVRRSYACTGP